MTRANLLGALAQTISDITKRDFDEVLPAVQAGIDEGKALTDLFPAKTAFSKSVRTVTAVKKTFGWKVDPNKPLKSQCS